MLAYFAVILTVLIGFCGLAVDVGRMELRTNQLQAAADAAALAGASEIMHSSNLTYAQQAAYNDAMQVAAANNIPAPTMGGGFGSSSGFYVNDYSVVEITLTQSIPTFFFGLLSHANSSYTLSVTADAQIPPCALFLGGPALAQTYDFWSGSSSFSPPLGCPGYFQSGFYIESTSSLANSQPRAAGASGSSSFTGTSSFAPIYSVPAIADPLAYITAPTAGACSNSTTISKLNQSSATTIALTPGTYCGKTAAYTGTSRCNTGSYAITPAIDIQGTQSSSTCPSAGYTNGGNCTATPTVTFSPGLYIIVGGMNLACVKATGSGVTLYFTKSSSVSYGTFKMLSSTWNVNAPNTASGGSIAGVSVMSDRNWTASQSGATEDFQWQYGTYDADGVIYLTGTGLNAYDEDMSAPDYLNFVIANMYSIDAAVTPANNYANIPTGNPLRLNPTLVQ